LEKGILANHNMGIYMKAYIENLKWALIDWYMGSEPLGPDAPRP
jgi:hypothetical protein